MDEIIEQLDELREMVSEYSEQAGKHGQDASLRDGRRCGRRRLADRAPAAVRSKSIAAIKRHPRGLLAGGVADHRDQLRSVMRRTGLFAFAGLIAVFGLAMLNVAAYFALAPIWGDALAMLAVAVADFVIAGILIAIAAATATRPRP